MPRIKRFPTPDYRGTGKSDEPVVQKSKPFISLVDSEMTLPELKILDFYLSRINSHEPEMRTVFFKKGELERILKVKKINKEDLDSRLNRLFTSVRLWDDNAGHYHKIALFEEIQGSRAIDGEWEIILTCTPAAKKYIFNIDNLGYLQYRLSNIVNLTSRYSYAMFLYLENNRFRKSWEVSLTDLHTELGVHGETYVDFYRFNDLILKKVQKELNEKTACHFTYKTRRKNRRVWSLVISLESNAAEIPDEINVDSADPAEDISAKAILKDVPEEDIAEIERLIDLLPESILPKNATAAQRAEYLKTRYKSMMTVNVKSKIKYKGKYLVKMIHQDIESVKTDKHQSTFGSFDTDDFIKAALERSEKEMKKGRKE